MKTLQEYIKWADENKVAIGHFNISNIEGLHGIYNAGKKLTNEVGYQIPIIIGVSEGEEKFIGREEVFALVKTIRDRDNYPIFLNADHHSTPESVITCIQTGFDMVIIDGAKLEIEENIKITKACTDYAKEFEQQTGKKVLVEAELGYIGSGSDIKDSIPDGAGILTRPEDAKYFVEKTKIDVFAPSVGSIHGIVKSGKPHIDSDVVRQIKQAVNIPLVLHGGSGLRDEDFTNAILAGINIIHINSELRLAYRQAIEESLNENKEEINPSKILKPAVDAIEKIVYERLKLFNNI